MRLRADGHGEVRVVGPRGVAALAGALRHLVAWRHPTVFVDEVVEGGGAYADDRVDVVAVGAGGGWAAPSAWKVRRRTPSPPPSSSTSPSPSSSAASSSDDGAGARAPPAPALPPPASDYSLFDPTWRTPLYVKRPVADPSDASTIWAYVVWIRAASAAVAVVDVAGETALAAARSHALAAWLADPASPVAAIVHLTPAAVARTPAYQAWASGLASASPSRPRVLAAVPPGAPEAAIGHLSSARLLARLAVVDEALFPVPGGREGGGDDPAPALTAGLLPGSLLMRLVGHDGGRATIDVSACPPPFDREAAMADAAAAAGAPPPPPKRARRADNAPPCSNASAASALRARLGGGGTAEPLPPPPPPPPTTPTLTFLGTGSAEPSAHRGASSMYLACPSGRGALLDAGEGAAGALKRALGAEGGRKAFASLSLLWLSHKHADHVLGAVGVLEARPVGAPPLLVVAPAAAARWLQSAAAATGVADRALVVPAHALYGPAGAPARAAVCTALGLDSFRLVPALHCADAHGCVARAARWSLAVSGDTAPTPGFAAAAAGVDLMVHEATFADAERAHADRKRHATTAGALGVAAAAAVRATLLTHFSQRHPGLPPDARADPQRLLVAGAGAAFDGMRVPLSHAREAVAATAALAEAAAAEMVAAEDGADAPPDPGSGYESGE